MPETTGNNDTNDVKMFDENYVKELRSEAANYRTQLREREQELESLKSEKQSMESQMKQTKVQQIAEKKGAVDPQTVAKLVDLSDTSDDSAVEGRVDSLLQEKPFLASGGQVGKPSNPGGTETVQTFTRSDIERMTPEQINQHWDQISQSLENGTL